ncbi:MAG: methyltransferase domain-containing protein [Alphaproteobacteria bacterium]|nr:methyltransferase domain-containing protein [Alphaproteobacteria bacterium]
MATTSLDTRSIGLDVGLSFSKWLTGMENLHYGDWTGLEVTAANVGPAQVAYTDRLFSYLPDTLCRILDIGGGAGETARKLIERGHEVEIVIPSPFLAQRCRENAPQAKVHETGFEDFAGAPRFDICLFSESFQYIPLDIGLSKALGLLTPGGRIVLADCFRSETYKRDRTRATVGGGHRITAFRRRVADLDLEVLDEIDITEAVAPSVDVEQGLYNILGHAITRVDDELQMKRPRSRWVLHRLAGLFLNGRRRARMHQRLMEQTRTSEVFVANNTYLMLGLRPRG